MIYDPAEHEIVTLPELAGLISSAPDLDAVKAMLLDALTKSAINQSQNITSPNGYAHGVPIESWSFEDGFFNADKLAATVSEWFAEAQLSDAPAETSEPSAPEPSEADAWKHGSPALGPLTPAELDDELQITEEALAFKDYMSTNLEALLQARMERLANAVQAPGRGDDR